MEIMRRFEKKEGRSEIVVSRTASSTSPPNVAIIPTPPRKDQGAREEDVQQATIRTCLALPVYLRSMSQQPYLRTGRTGKISERY